MQPSVMFLFFSAAKRGHCASNNKGRNVSSSQIFVRLFVRFRPSVNTFSSVSYVADRYFDVVPSPVSLADCYLGCGPGIVEGGLAQSRARRAHASVS